jgi:dTDP-4-dehydrorhamnose 3,5-epimerase
MDPEHRLLPEGAELRGLDPHRDSRGTFTELFREEWEMGVVPVQWNAVRSEAGVLRGVHVHLRHSDCLAVPIGRATVGLHDTRPWSTTASLVTTLELGEHRPAALSIPPGVAHGFYFHEPSLHVYAVSHYWDPADELGCRWDDPDLGIPWPEQPRLLSARDESLGTLGDLRQSVVSGITSMAVEPG